MFTMHVVDVETEDFYIDDESVSERSKYEDTPSCMAVSAHVHTLELRIGSLLLISSVNKVAKRVSLVESQHKLRERSSIR